MRHRIADAKSRRDTSTGPFDGDESMDNQYVPINCSYYDELEILAMHKQACTIEYFDDEQTTKSADGVIADVFSKEKQEFLKLDSGEVIRLDRLISVNGKPLPGQCEL